MTAATVFAVLVAVDPIGFGRVWPNRVEISVYVAVVLVVATLVADPVLDVLDLSPPGFWLAAGIVLLVPAMSRLVGGATRDVAGPAGALVAIACATRDGVGSTLLAVAVTCAAVVFALRFVRDGRVAVAGERVVGGLMVVVAFDLLRDGVMAV